MDVFADILEPLQASGHCGRVDYREPFALHIQPQSEAAFVYVTGGQCFLSMDGETESTRLQQGDLVLMPHGDGHAFSDGVTVPTLEFRDLWSRDDGPYSVIALGGNGDGCSTIWGAYVFDGRARNPLRDVLPHKLVFRASDLVLDRALYDTLRLLVVELAEHRDGSSVVCLRLVDILFLQLLRNWSERNPEGRVGWMFALQDDRIRRAVASIHKNPEQHWTVEQLAREVSMSRSAFFDHFRSLVGESPGAYLHAWRMQLAAQLLRTSPATVADIASRVGYDSEFSFSRAFSRYWGVPPSEHRRSATRRTPHKDATDNGL